VWAATNHYRVRHRLAVAPVVSRAISRPLLRPTSLPLLHPDRETTDELDQALRFRDGGGADRRIPVVLVEQHSHWLITHDTAMTALDAFWYNANRRPPVVVWAK
jgi:hypothetical protein